MRPILINLGPFPIYSFGFFSALAFLVGSFMLWRSLRDEISEEELLITSLLIGIGATLGARGLPALRAFFIKPTLDMFVRAFLAGNLSLVGALIGGLVPLYLWQKRTVSQPWDLVDPLGNIFLWVAAITALGVQLSGSWWGKPAAYLGAIGGVHPVGLYMAIWCFLGIIISVFVKNQHRHWSWYKSGKVGLTGLFCIGWFALGLLTVATLVEKQLYWGPFPQDQSLSLIVLILSLFLIWKRAGRSLGELIVWQPRKNH